MSEYLFEAFDEDYDEDFDEVFGEDYDEDFDEDYDEARRGRRSKRRGRGMKRARPAGRGKSFRKPPAPASNAVTQAQLKSALAVVDKKIGTNSSAIKVVDTRGRRTASEQGRMGSALRKEITDRKKENEAMRNNLQTFAIAPLLFKGTSLESIAPLLILGDGFGGSSSSSSSSNSGGLFGGGSTGLIALLAISGALTPKATTP